MFSKFFKSNFKVKRQPDTCVLLENLSAQWKEVVVVRQVPLIQQPIVQTITETICTREAAVERVAECQPDGTICIKVVEIPEVVETITYQIVTGYTTIQEASVVQVVTQQKVADGDVVESC